MIVNSTQCTTAGLSGANIVNECYWYNDGCKTKCSLLLNSEECGDGSRTNDCFEAKEAGGTQNSSCHDKVCIIYIHTCTYYLFVDFYIHPFSFLFI
jgi:hypothetical protein